MEASVIVENETIETVIGQASRKSSRPGRSAQGSAVVRAVRVEAEETETEDIKALATFGSGKLGSPPRAENGAGPSWLEPAAGE
ncbi:MAG TPA: hypothetical protein VNO30_33095 [Kofleriaceae bacterium]|nr:hypothetical protein [Kofleriaceae bacterium]